MRLRRRLRDAHQPVLRGQLAALLERERVEVMAGAQAAKRADDALQAFLRDYYARHQQVVADAMAGSILGYGGAVRDAATQEVGGDVPTDLMPFMLAYVAHFGARYAGGQLLGTLKAADAPDPLVSLSELFARWRETRPADIAASEVVRGGDATAVVTWERLGIPKLRWVAFGKNCPYCNHLNGRVVGIADQFLGQGEDFQPPGAPSPLRPGTKVRHAPAHRGCDCTVVPRRR